MLLTIHNRTLLRGMLAGAVAVGTVSACSRSDRAEGRDTTQTGAGVTPADTQASIATQPTTTDTAVASVRDTGNAGGETAVTDTAPAEMANAAVDTAATAEPDTSTDTTAAGYEPMARDTSVALAQGATTQLAVKDQPDTVTVVGDSSSVDKPGPRAKEDTVSQKADSLAKYHEADRVRPPGDSTEPLGQVTTPDTTAAGYEPMARDTSVALAQGDTVGLAQTDTAVQAETDTAAMEVQVDTSTEVGDSSSVDQPGPRAKEDTVAQKADSLAQYHEAERVRPPEDSTETLGQVTTDEPNYDVEAIGDANGEVVGAAQVQSTGNIATGADAVALMTREGEPCRVEDSRDVQWDMASSPATLNPCGSGTMTLPKVQTGEKK